MSTASSKLTPFLAVEGAGLFFSSFLAVVAAFDAAFFLAGAFLAGAALARAFLAGAESDGVRGHGPAEPHRAPPPLAFGLKSGVLSGSGFGHLI